MKKVIVYIDGFNLYYGMLKGTPYKWLDLEKFVDALVADDVEVVAIKYFTAQIKTYPFDLQKVHRQQFYIRAVSMLPRVKVIEGFYTKHKIRMPFYKEPCISCDKTDGMASVVKLEEKRSDVNIATYKNVPRDLPAQCQLPEAIPVGTHGNFIRRPEAWK